MSPESLKERSHTPRRARVDSTCAGASVISKNFCNGEVMPLRVLAWTVKYRTGPGGGAVEWELCSCCRFPEGQ